MKSLDRYGVYFRPLTVLRALGRNVTGMVVSKGLLEKLREIFGDPFDWKILAGHTYDKPPLVSFPLHY